MAAVKCGVDCRAASRVRLPRVTERPSGSTLDGARVPPLAVLPREVGCAVDGGPVADLAVGPARARRRRPGRAQARRAPDSPARDLRADPAPARTDDDPRARGAGGGRGLPARSNDGGLARLGRFVLEGSAWTPYPPAHHASWDGATGRAAYPGGGRPGDP